MSDDPTMPFLAAALDPLEVRRQFDRRIRIARSRRLRAIRVMRYKAGRRSLIGYELGPQAADDMSAPLILIGKARVRGVDHSTAELLGALIGAGFGADSADGIAVPEPVGIVPEFRMWLQRKVPGLPATEVLPALGGGEIARRIADAIHKLHQADLSPARRHTMWDELRIIHERLLSVAQARPRWAARLERLLDACDRLGADVRAPHTRGIHRDFYPDQVVVDGSRLYLLDFDLYCEGDPALDVGNFSAHLIEQALRTLGDPTALADRQAALEERFLELVGPEMRGPIRTYTILTLVRHIWISTQIPDRRHWTEALLELCEEQLDIG